jgi:hypothetical protein
MKVQAKVGRGENILLGSAFRINVGLLGIINSGFVLMMTPIRSFYLVAKE